MRVVVVVEVLLLLAAFTFTLLLVAPAAAAAAALCDLLAPLSVPTGRGNDEGKAGMANSPSFIFIFLVTFELSASVPSSSMLPVLLARNLPPPSEASVVLSMLQVRTASKPPIVPVPIN